MTTPQIIVLYGVARPKVKVELLEVHGLTYLSIK